MGNRCIGPPVPGRHAQLAAQFVDAVDGAALVAAGYNHLLPLGRNDEFLAFAFQVGQFQFVYLLVLAQGSNQNRWSFHRFSRSLAQYAFHVVTQVLDGHLYAFVFLLAIAYCGISQRHAIGLG